MSEERKNQKNNGFYWPVGFIVFGLVALACIFLYLKYFTHPDNEKHANYAIQARKDSISMAIGDFQKWTKGLPDHRMNIDHELTSTGLRKIANILFLIDTLRTNSTGPAKANIDSIRMMADSVTFNWKSGRHADMIKEGFTKTADVITTLFPNKTPALAHAVDDLKLKMQDINQKVLTLNQRDEVKAAFQQTAEVFRQTGYKP